MNTINETQPDTGMVCVLEQNKVIYGSPLCLNSSNIVVFEQSQFQGNDVNKYGETLHHTKMVMSDPHNITSHYESNDREFSMTTNFVSSSLISDKVFHLYLGFT